MIKEGLYEKNTIISILFFGFIGSMFAFDGYIEITNATGFDVYYIYVSHEYDDEWGDDLLEDEILLSDGDTFTVYLEEYDTSYFDIRLEDEEGDTYTIYDVDVSVDDLYVTLDDLDY